MRSGFEIFEFQHFRFEGSAGVTVAICREPKKVRCYRDAKRLSPKVPEGMGVVAVAFSDPSEHSFSRKEGRKQAVKKLTDYEHHAKHIKYVELGTKIQMADQALQLVSKPLWYKKMMKAKKKARSSIVDVQPMAAPVDHGFVKQHEYTSTKKKSE